MDPSNNFTTKIKSPRLLSGLYDEKIIQNVRVNLVFPGCQIKVDLGGSLVWTSWRRSHIRWFKELCRSQHNFLIHKNDPCRLIHYSKTMVHNYTSYKEVKYIRNTIFNGYGKDILYKSTHIIIESLVTSG